MLPYPQNKIPNKHPSQVSPSPINKIKIIATQSNNKINFSDQDYRTKTSHTVRNKTARFSKVGPKSPVINGMNFDLAKFRPQKQVEIKLPVNRKLMLIKKNFNPKNNTAVSNRFCSEQSEKISLQEFNQQPIHRSKELRSPTSYNYDAKSELKAKIIKAILSSNETIEREQAYRKQYEKQLKYRRSQKSHHKSRSLVNANQQKFRPYFQMTESHLDNLSKYNNNSPSNIHFQNAQQNLDLLCNSPNYDKTSRKINSVLYRHYDYKNCTNRKKNNSIFKESDLCNSQNAFFKEISPKKKQSEVEEIMPWAIAENDTTIVLRALQ